MAARIEIPFAFYYASGPGMTPAAGVTTTVYFRNTDGTRGVTAAVYGSQSASSPLSSLQTDGSGNVPGWVNEGTYQIVASSSGSFPGGTINFDALYGGGTSLVAAGVIGSTHLQSGAVDFAQLTTIVTQSLVPAGVFLEYSGAVLPPGYLWCDGTSYSISTYANLFNALGYQWGGSGGSFNVPDTRSRVVVGAGNGSGLTARTLAQTGGEENHALALGEMPVHNHSASVSDPTHAHGVYDPGHGHSVGNTPPAGSGWQAAWTPSSYSTIGNNASSGSSGVVWVTNGGYGPNTGAHSHPISGSGIGLGIVGASTRISVAPDNQGSSTLHNNMQPYLALNHIIKY